MPPPPDQALSLSTASSSQSRGATLTSQMDIDNGIPECCWESLSAIMSLNTLGVWPQASWWIACFSWWAPKFCARKADCGHTQSSAALPQCSTCHLKPTHQISVLNLFGDTDYVKVASVTSPDSVGLGTVPYHGRWYCLLDAHSIRPGSPSGHMR